MSNSKNRAVMMLVSRRVKPGYEAEFERLMEQFIDAAANFPGCLGAQLVSPGDEVDVEDSLYHAVLNPVQLESRRFCDGRFAGWRC
jgi:uncharacterized protein